MNQKQESTSPEPAGRDQHARRLFVIILILAGFGIIGGFYSIRTAIQQPLSFTNTSEITNQLSQTDTEALAEEERLVVLKSKDSDKDTLSDYDELYQHGTSPYLADSDSDGISDKDEITNGEDPNCPQGQECSALAIFGSDSETSSSAILNTNSAESTQVTASEIRTALKNAGASQTELDALTDEELLEAYADVVADENTAATNTNATNTATNTEIELDDVTIAELRDLSISEIRQLLILGGADEATLDEIDDETLKTVYLESLQNLITQ